MVLVIEHMFDDEAIYMIEEIYLPRDIRMRVINDPRQTPNYRTLEIIFNPTNEVVLTMYEDPSHELFGFRRIFDDTDFAVIIADLINGGYLNPEPLP